MLRFFNIITTLLFLIFCAIINIYGKLDNCYNTTIKQKKEKINESIKQIYETKYF